MVVIPGDEHAGMQEDFREVVDAIPGLIWTTQDDGESRFVNRAWREYTGQSLDEVAAHGWQNAIHADDLAAFRQSWERIRQSGISREIDVRLRRSDGQYRWHAFRPALLSQANREWCWLAMDADEGPETDGRLRRLWDMLPFRSGFLNRQGILQWGNLEARQKVLGASLEQMREWKTSGIMHLDDVKRNQVPLDALLATGEPYDQEIRMRHRDGHYRWARARAVPIRDAQGNIVRFLSCQFDIDDLRRAEALLAAEVKLLEMVARGDQLEQTLDALSRHVEELCGECVCGVLIAAPDRRHFHVAAGPNLPNALREILEGGAVDGSRDPYSLAMIEKTTVTTQIVLDPRWGNSEWLQIAKGLGFLSCCAVPVRTASGGVWGVIAINRSEPIPLALREENIIDRFAKIAGIAIDRSDGDAALQARECELREALAQLSEGQRLSKTGSFTSDMQRDRHSWSDEFCRIFEFDCATQPKLDAVRERIHPDDLPFFDTEIHRRNEGPVSDFNFRVITPKYGLKHLRGISQVIEHAAGRPIFMGSIQDITESKLAEAELTRARAELAHVARVATLNAMAASIAHEVSQPLSGILTNANTNVRMLAADPPNLAGAATTAHRIIRDANRATEVVQRLRAMFSTKPPTLEIADINDVVREVIALSIGELRRDGGVVVTDFAEHLPPVNIDRVQLQQVILNLLLNAADAMADVKDRPRTLLVQTGLHQEGSVRVCVRDSGVGIDPETVEKLFDSFYTTKDKGMGVGLSISRSIIARHEGRLWAEANDGPGATFIFCIPGINDDASHSR